MINIDLFAIACSQSHIQYYFMKKVPKIISLQSLTTNNIWKQTTTAKPFTRIIDCLFTIFTYWQ